MRSETGSAPGFNAGATAAGAIAGLVTLVLLGTVLGLVLYRYPFSATATSWAVLASRLLAYVVAGIWAGRRAGDGGLLHGSGAGLLQLVLALVIALVAREGWPALHTLLPQLGFALGAGGLGGVLGVNLAA